VSLCKPETTKPIDVIRLHFPETSLARQGFGIGFPDSQGSLGRRYQLHPKITRSALETGQIALLPSALEFLCPLVDPKLSFCNQSIEQTRQDSGHRFDGFQPAQLSSQVSVPGTQITHTAYQGLGGNAKGIPHAVSVVFSRVAVSTFIFWHSMKFKTHRENTELRSIKRSIERSLRKRDSESVPLRVKPSIAAKSCWNICSDWRKALMCLDHTGTEATSITHPV
jgi:hypothetical protein